MLALATLLTIADHCGQVHHKAIIEWNEASHAHDHYNFFRSELADSYSEGLDAMLERILIFLDEVRAWADGSPTCVCRRAYFSVLQVSGVPVLLSLLVLVLRERSPQSGLPSNSLELYEMAMDAAMRQCLGSAVESSDLQNLMTMFAKVGFANHGAERRIFTSDDVGKALVEEGSELLKCWGRIPAEEPPLLKVLEVATPAFPATTYQFRHLSMQEALFVRHCRAQGWELWADPKRAVEFLNNPWNVNPCRIGGGVFCEAGVCHPLACYLHFAW